MPGNPYMDAFEQFSVMQPPDPNTMLKLIWPHLDQNTRALVRALLAAPANAQVAPATVGVQDGLSGFDASGKVRLSPNDPDAPRLLKERPNEYVMTAADKAAPHLAKLAADAGAPKDPETGAAVQANTVKESGLKDLMKNLGISQEEALKRLGGATVTKDRPDTF